MKYISEGIVYMKLYKNWLDFFKDHFGTIKDKIIQYELFTGQKVFCRAGGDDKYVFKEIYMTKAYREFEEFIPKENDIIIDIGANIGAYSLWVSHVTKNTADITCFEIEKENSDILLLNTSSYNNIKTHNLGVAGRTSERILNKSNHSCRHSITHMKDSSSEVDIVSCLSINKILKNFDKVDILKIDAEGAEGEIFRHMSKASFDKVNKILCEQDFSHDSEITNKIIDKIQSNGFVCQMIDGMLYCQRN